MTTITPRWLVHLLPWEPVEAGIYRLNKVRHPETVDVVPLIPSDKVPLDEGKTKILLLRVGQERRGVVGLYQPGLTGEQSLGLSVRFMASHATRSRPT